MAGETKLVFDTEADFGGVFCPLIAAKQLASDRDVPCGPPIVELCGDVLTSVILHVLSL